MNNLGNESSTLYMLMRPLIAYNVRLDLNKLYKKKKKKTRVDTCKFKIRFQIILNHIEIVIDTTW